MESIIDDDRKHFTETFFTLLGAMGNVSVLDAIKHPFTYWKTVRRKYKKMSVEDRKFLLDIFNSYGKISKRIRKEFKERKKKLRELKRLNKDF
jgi:hypothetical protein